MVTNQPDENSTGRNGKRVSPLIIAIACATRSQKNRIVHDCVIDVET
jgi:hypothetical protein